MNLSHGGHLTHGSKASLSGKYFEAHFYGVDPETETIDYDALARVAEEVRPKLIIAGASAYPRVIDFARFRAVADSVGAYLMVDMAHIGGLVAAGVHPSPVPYADVVTCTTHKTLRGPRGAIILCRDELAKKIDSAVFPGTQGKRRLRRVRRPKSPPPVRRDVPPAKNAGRGKPAPAKGRGKPASGNLGRRDLFSSPWC